MALTGAEEKATYYNMIIHIYLMLFLSGLWRTCYLRVFRAYTSCLCSISCIRFHLSFILICASISFQLFLHIKFQRWYFTNTFSRYSSLPRLSPSLSTIPRSPFPSCRYPYSAPPLPPPILPAIIISLPSSLSPSPSPRLSLVVLRHGEVRVRQASLLLIIQVTRCAEAVSSWCPLLRPPVG